MTKEERLEIWNENFKKWNAFNDDLETFIVIGNTFDIKDELKKKGAKFSEELGWHFDHEEPGYVLEKVTYKEVGKNTPDGKLIIDYVNAPEVIKKLQEKHMEPSNSEWIGEIGEKICVHVILERTHQFQGAFGLTNVLSFKDDDENVIVWMTTKNVSADIGDLCYLKGNVKSHNIFRGEKQTILNRCIIDVIE